MHNLLINACHYILLSMVLVWFPFPNYEIGTIIMNDLSYV